MDLSSKLTSGSHTDCLCHFLCFIHSAQDTQRESTRFTASALCLTNKVVHTEKRVRRITRESCHTQRGRIYTVDFRLTRYLRVLENGWNSFGLDLARVVVLFSSDSLYDFFTPVRTISAVVTCDSILTVSAQ